MSGHVIVIGGGHGGGAAVSFLRQNKFAGEITLIGDEPLLPYHRPPLSKAWLKGEADGDSLALRPASYYENAGITTRLSTRVAAVDRDGKTVRFWGGTG